MDQPEPRLSTALEASQNPRNCLGLFRVPENKAKLAREDPNAFANLVSRTQFYVKEEQEAHLGSLLRNAPMSSRKAHVITTHL